MKRLITILVLSLIVGALASAQSRGRGYLGIVSNPVSQQKAKVLGFSNPHGSYVTRVLKNSAAEAAGIQPFDYIFGINDQQTTFTKDLTTLLEDYKPGDKVTVHYVRNGEQKSVEATLGRSVPNVPIIDKQPFLGVSPHPDSDDDRLGMRVYVVRNSPAEAMGLQDGDVILTINGYKIVDWDDISTSLGMLQIGDKLRVEYERSGKKQTAEGEAKSRGLTAGRAELPVPPFPPFLEWGALGIYSNEVSKEKAKKLGFDNPYGSYVREVLPGTAAEKAGLQPFDYIYGINDLRTAQNQNLTSLLKKFKPGDEVTVHYIRQGKPQTVTVTLGKRVSGGIRMQDCESPLLGINEMSIAEQGVVVNVVKKSTAAEMGLERGDIITHINGYPIIDWSDVSTAINMVKVRDIVHVTFLRKGNVMTASGPIKSYCETYPEDGRMSWGWEDQTDESPADSGAVIRDVDASRAVVDLKDLTLEESGELKQKFGIDLRTTGLLNIKNLSIQPNTATGRYVLQFNLPQEGETQINVYNAAGRIIYNYDLGKFKGDFSDQIDIAQNGVGNYYLEIRQNSQVLVQKILLQTR